MIHDLKKQGLSNTAVAGQLGISRRTVERRQKRGLEAPVYGPRPRKPRLIEPFEAYLRDRVMAWPDLSDMRLLREIKERGYTGGYSAVTDFLREVRPPAVKLHERRYETKPGQQAQVDFAYFEVELTDTPGTRQVIWLFTMVFGYSRYLWGRVLPEPEAGGRPSLPHRRVCRSRRRAGRDSLRPHEDRGYRHRRGWRRGLQPVSGRTCQSLPLSAQSLPAPSGEMCWKVGDGI